MILELFITLFLLSIILIIVGYWKEKPFAYLVGYAFLFILGVVFSGTTVPAINDPGVQYKTGFTIIDTGNTQTITYTYDTYSNLIVGWLFALASFWLFLLVILQEGAKVL